MKKRSSVMRQLRCASLIALLFLVCTGAAFPYEAGEGYDENTEVTVTGTVQEVFRKVRGPVIIRLAYGEKVYNVLTAPPWYLEAQGSTFLPGLEIEVTGSKFLGQDGGVYLVARKLKEMKTQKEIMLRDDLLRPLWRGRHRMGSDESGCPLIPLGPRV